MKVSLVTATPEPVATVIVASENMSGNVLTSTQELHDTMARSDIHKKFVGLGATKLAGPLEFVHFFFQIADVPRWFTHQLVRTRIASYSQVSMRFNAPELNQFGLMKMWEPKFTTPGQEAAWRATCAIQEQCYLDLIKNGVPMEDARGILPNGVLTAIGMDVSLKTLMGMAENRLCFQAQPIWTEFMAQVVEQIRGYYPDHSEGELVASMLMCACDRYGKCSFKGTYDRPCPRQARFE